MNKKIIYLIIMVFILLTGCNSIVTEEGKARELVSNLDVMTSCDDNVVCYCQRGSCSFGLSCFKDIDLATKYC